MGACCGGLGGLLVTSGSLPGASQSAASRFLRPTPLRRQPYPTNGGGYGAAAEAQEGLCESGEESCVVSGGPGGKAVGHCLQHRARRRGSSSCSAAAAVAADAATTEAIFPSSTPAYGISAARPRRRCRNCGTCGGATAAATPPPRAAAGALSGGVRPSAQGSAASGCEGRCASRPGHLDAHHLTHTTQLGVLGTGEPLQEAQEHRLCPPCAMEISRSST